MPEQPTTGDLTGLTSCPGCGLLLSAVDGPTQMRQRVERRADPAGTRPVEVVDRAALVRAARELISTGQARIDDGALAPLGARVVNFWRGDAVLEIVTATSGSRTRLPRNLGSEHDGLLVDYLAMCAGNASR